MSNMHPQKDIIKGAQISGDINVADFARDMCDLFGKRKGGHTERWVYQSGKRPLNLPPGDRLWTEFARVAKYYIPAEDAANILSHTEDIAERFPHVTALVDFGSGDEDAFSNKINPLLNVLFEEKDGLYVPVDISKALLERVQETAKILEPGIRTQPIHGDFYRKTSMKTGQPYTLPRRRSLGVMFGSTISNMNMQLDDEFPFDSVVHKVARLRNQIANNGAGDGGLAISYDSNQNFREVVDAYNTEALENMLKLLMVDVQHILGPEGNFDPFSWDFDIVPRQEEHVIHLCLKSTKDQHFSIPDGKGGRETFRIKAGERFPIVNLLKYPPSVFQEILENAGCIPHEPLMSTQARMVLATADINYDVPDPSERSVA